MTTNYFNIEVEPTFTGANAVTAFADDDILFDWTAFDVPRGASALLGVTVIVRGTNASRQEQPLDIYFAKDKVINGIDYAPGSLGSVNAAADGANSVNHIAGSVKILATDYQDGLTHHAAAHKDLSNGIVLETLPTTGSTAGFDRLYIAGIAKGAFDFGTGVLVNQGGGIAAATAQTAIPTDGSAAGRCLAIGDVVVAQDGAAIGTVTSVGSSEVVVDAVADALADNDEILCSQPLKFILHFAK